MRNHLKSKHQIFIDSTPSPLQQSILNQLQQLYLKADSLDQTQQIDTQAFQSILSQDIIDEALVSLIVVQNFPFSVVEWPEFHTLCRVLNPESESCIITAHNSVPKKIEQSWLVQKDIIRKKLQSALSSVHLSLDIWTSPNRLLFLGICAHFVEQSDEKLSKALIALRIMANHSGEEQFITLLPVLKDYGILQKLGAVVCDNHTANDKLCRTIAKYLRKEGMKWDQTYRRIFCIGHVINLAVQAFLFHDIVDIEQFSLYDEQSWKMKEQMIYKEKLLSTQLGRLENFIILWLIFVAQLAVQKSSKIWLGG